MRFRKISVTDRLSIIVLRISKKWGMIQRLVPNARVGIGHGQMDGKTRGIDAGFYEW
jgi:hypothetical protein